MKIKLVGVGSLKTSWAKDGCQQYLDRLSIDLVELPASKQKDSAKQLKEESASILKHLEKTSGQVWVLDERGQAFTSESFAAELESISDRGEQITFVLGGAYGLNDQVRSKADKLIKLSDMVLPHELCRIFILEQIYRADQICKKSGYHH